MARLSQLKYTLNGATLCHWKSTVSGVFCAEGLIGTDRSTLLPRIDGRSDLCPPGVDYPKGWEWNVCGGARSLRLHS
jgi:hypothetical protein